MDWDTDADRLHRLASVSVWLRWGVGATCLLIVIYSYANKPVPSALHLGLLTAFVAGNLGLHAMVWHGRRVRWPVMLFFPAFDVALITACVAFTSNEARAFAYLLFFPALVSFALFFPSFFLTAGWTTVVASIYAALHHFLSVPDAADGAPLRVMLAHGAVMYATTTLVGVTVRSDSRRHAAALDREDALKRSHIALSRAVHDTAIQNAFALGLGLERTMRAAERHGDDDVLAPLESSVFLCAILMWNLRHPVGAGRFAEGVSLMEVLESSLLTYAQITQMNTEVVQEGVEPDLPLETKSLLYAIAHNALSNALRHSEALSIRLDAHFDRQVVRLSVADDGLGLPDDYETRGNGFANMQANAATMGGVLIVESGAGLEGTRVTCEIPMPSRVDA